MVEAYNSSDEDLDEEALRRGWEELERERKKLDEDRARFDRMVEDQRRLADD